jgi:hypothetical protein
MRRSLLVAVAVVVLGVVSIARAQEEEPATKVAVKGRLAGGEYLLNPIWNAAKDPKGHRYTFRAPSATVGRDAKTLTAYLPKELCIAALAAGKADPQPTPVQIHVSGGRTTPVTVVVAEGQNVQFINDDPFPHKLYDTGKAQGGLGAEETRPATQRTWKPPAKGVYEIRDAYFPSIRAWIVVEPRAAATGYPTLLNPKEFVVSGLFPGSYTLQAYFMGKPTGKPMPVEVTGAELQPLGQVLTVAEKPKKEG